MDRLPSANLPSDVAGPSAAVPPTVGFAEALRWRLGQTRVFFIASAGYALAAAIALAFGWMHADVLISSGIFFILVLGLDLIYGCAGMLSFAHVGFFAVGAYAVAIGSVTHGLDQWLSGAIGLAVNVALSYLLGRVCLRLTGSYFMLGTLAFGIMVHAVITVAHPLTGGDVGLGGVPRPSIAGIQLSSNAAFGTLVAVIAAALFWFTLALAKSPTGRALKAVRSEPAAAASLGTDVARLKTNVFVLSACYASVAGSLFAMYHGAVHPDSFNLGVLLNVLLMLFLGGEGSIWGALIGATFISILPDISGPLHAAKDLFNGILFSLIILVFPSGVAGAIERRFGKRRHVQAADTVAVDALATTFAAPAAALAEARAGEEPVLRVESVGKRFGGVQAVDALSFDIASGTVKGLMGPNGAGKSTLINLVSGAIAPDDGRILLDGSDLIGLRPDQIARAGVLRTFQHEKLFAHLTAEENVMVGYERGGEAGLGALIGGALTLRRAAAHERMARAEARRWLAAVGLGAHADAFVSELPTGLRKLVEVARSCAAGPRVLLLDETAAGLNDTERQAFRAIVRGLRASGLTILLIEHDIDLVMELSDEICVIDFGRRIADGKPDAVRNDPQVIAAYLGT